MKNEKENFLMHFDEFKFKEEIELMNIQRQMEQNQIKNNQTFGFNLDTIYNEVDNNKTQL